MTLPTKETLYAIVERFVQAHALVSVTLNSERENTVRGRCRHREDHTLWIEVNHVVTENLADRPYINESRIPNPEQWTRVKDVYITIEEIHPVIRAGWVDSRADNPCQFCGQTDYEYNREREPIDFLGEARYKIGRY